MVRTDVVWSLLLVTWPLASSAAPGDLLWSCSFAEAGTTPAEVVASCGGDSNGMTSASLVSGGHDGGTAMSFFYPSTGELYDPFWTPNLDRVELTLVYWERFDVAESASTQWNVKSVRVYSGADFMGGMMSHWGAGSWNQGHLGAGNATLTVSSAVTSVADWAGYCTLVGGDTWTCPDNQMALRWSPGFGTAWRKVRIYLRAPSSVAAADGVTTLWIDER